MWIQNIGDGIRCLYETEMITIVPVDAISQQVGLDVISFLISHIFRNKIKNLHNPTTVIAEYDRGMFLVAKQKQKTYRIDKSIILFHFARRMTINKTKTNLFWWQGDTIG